MFFVGKKNDFYLNLLYYIHIKSNFFSLDYCP